jgi:Tol biopolymer transport system component
VCLADIFTIPATGGAEIELTRNTAGVAGEPAWSPDGSEIAYSQGGKLFVNRPDGTGKTIVSKDPTRYDSVPCGRRTPRGWPLRGT